jgi:hypothetical protein
MARVLKPALLVGLLLGIPMLILQRWVAETRFAAIALVVAWMALVGIGLALYTWRRPALRLPVLGTWFAIVAGTIAIGYLTGFRDERVDEDVVMASATIGGGDLNDALAGGDQAAEEKPEAPGPVELASGDFSGADGHAGTGVATLIREPSGSRVLTFTEFDVDPGVDVDVYLTASPDDIDDRIELGDLKGNVGDQQYEIPADADLGRYSNVILWCKPFTVRIAFASLG